MYVLVVTADCSNVFYKYCYSKAIPDSLIQYALDHKRYDLMALPKSFNDCFSKNYLLDTVDHLLVPVIQKRWQ